CDWSSDVCSSDLEQIALRRGPFTFSLVEKGLKFRMFAVGFGEKALLGQLAVLLQTVVVTVDFANIFGNRYPLYLLQENIEVVVEPFRAKCIFRDEEAGQLTVVVHQVVDGPGKFDYVVDPAPLFGAQAGDHPFVGQRFAGEVVVPGMSEIEVVLEEVDMPQYMVEDHHVEPVGIVVIVEGDGGTGIDH